MFSCGQTVDKLGTLSGKKCVQSSTGKLASTLLPTYVVDKHCQTPQSSTQDLRSLSTSKIRYFRSVISLLIPSFHSTYYYQDELKII